MAYSSISLFGDHLLHSKKRLSCVSSWLRSITWLTAAVLSISLYSWWTLSSHLLIINQRWFKLNEKSRKHLFSWEADFSELSFTCFLNHHSHIFLISTGLQKKLSFHLRTIIHVMNNCKCDLCSWCYIKCPTCLCEWDRWCLQCTASWVCWCKRYQKQQKIQDDKAKRMKDRWLIKKDKQ